jgi:MFS family permease
VALFSLYPGADLLASSYFTPGGLFESVSWRWLFRLLSILSSTATVLAIVVVPRSRTVHGLSIREVLSRMDPVGLGLSVGAVILLVLSLTSGPEYGWKDPRFSATLPISAILFIGFFLWQKFGRNETNGILPPAIWRTPGIKALVFLK